MEPQARPHEPSPHPTKSLQPAREYLLRRVNPLTSLFLVLPLFLVYHLGVLLQVRRTAQGYAWVGNGVDFLTGTALSLVHGDPVVYAAGALAVAAVLAGMALWARRRARLHPRMFLPVLLESALYAFVVAWGVGRLVASLGLGGVEGRGLGAEVVASAGAGLHEELVFRAGLFAGLAWLLSRRMSTVWALVLSGLVSSALFSAVHYLGPLGDRFSLGSFAFRLFCGAVFAVIYKVRGFALAAWTHALYDVFYFLGRHA